MFAHNSDCTLLFFVYSYYNVKNVIIVSVMPTTLESSGCTYIHVWRDKHGIQDVRSHVWWYLVVSDTYTPVSIFFRNMILLIQVDPKTWRVRTKPLAIFRSLTFDISPCAANYIFFPLMSCHDILRHSYDWVRCKGI